MHLNAKNAHKIIFKCTENHNFKNSRYFCLRKRLKFKTIIFLVKYYNIMKIMELPSWLVEEI